MNRLIAQGCADISGTTATFCDDLAQTGAFDITPFAVVAAAAVIIGAAILVFRRMIWGRWLP